MYQEDDKTETIDGMMHRLKGNSKYRAAKTDAARKKNLKADIKRLMTYRRELFKEAEEALNTLKLIKETTVKYSYVSYTDFVITVASTVFGVNPDDLSLHTRLRQLVNARQYIYSNLKANDDRLTLTQLGTVFNGRPYDHATVSNSLKNHYIHIDIDKKYIDKCDRADKIIGKFLNKVI